MISKLINYIKSLNPLLSKDQLQRQLSSLREELDEYTLPTLKSALEVLADRRWETEPIQKLEKRFQREIHSRYHGNFVEITYEILKGLSSKVAKLEQIVGREFNEDIATRSLTYSRAQLLKLCEAADFLSRYSRAIVIYTLAKETSVVRESSTTRYRLTKGQIDWLEQKQTSFFVALKAFNRDQDKIKQILEDIPDIEIDEDTSEEVASQVGQRAIDPLNLNQVDNLAPIYHIRRKFTEWQVKRHEQAKEERRMVEYQIRDLRNALEQENDPKLEQALEYQLERLEKINGKIASFEEEVYNE